MQVAVVSTIADTSPHPVGSDTTEIRIMARGFYFDHASFGPADKVMVFDVWTSQAGQPSVMPIHNVIVPPARKASAKRAAPRKTARGRGKKR